MIVVMMRLWWWQLATREKDGKGDSVIMDDTNNYSEDIADVAMTMMM